MYLYYHKIVEIYNSLFLIGIMLLILNTLLIFAAKHTLIIALIGIFVNLLLDVKRKKAK